MGSPSVYPTRQRVWKILNWIAEYAEARKERREKREGGKKGRRAGSSVDVSSLRSSRFNRIQPRYQDAPVRRGRLRVARRSRGRLLESLIRPWCEKARALSRHRWFSRDNHVSEGRRGHLADTSWRVATPPTALPWATLGARLLLQQKMPALVTWVAGARPADKEPVRAEGSLPGQSGRDSGLAHGGRVCEPDLGR